MYWSDDPLDILLLIAMCGVVLMVWCGAVFMISYLLGVI